MSGCQECCRSSEGKYCVESYPQVEPESRDKRMICEQKTKNQHLLIYSAL